MGDRYRDGWAARNADGDDHFTTGPTGLAIRRAECPSCRLDNDYLVERDGAHRCVCGTRFHPA